jgi:uncharacterized metal-binding protein
MEGGPVVPPRGSCQAEVPVSPMTVRCAECQSYVCRGGIRDAGPDFCPMHEEYPLFERLYRDPRIRTMLKNAALIEARGYGRWTRLRELAEFSRLMGFRRLGIAHGPDLAGEARKVGEALASAEVTPLLPPPGHSLDPQALADLFREEGTDLNVVAGMRVAPEALFLRASDVPVVALIARDERLRHNPAAALYTSRSYLQDALHGHWPATERGSVQDPSTALKSMATELDPTGGEPPPTRLEEALSVVHRMGVSHLGISFCVGFRAEAEILSRILAVNGFKVSSACCKTGATPKEEVGIRDEEKIRPGRPEMICNPVAQAELLNRDGVQFTFVLGQCVGHDAATFWHLEAPGICLVAKDRVLAHNPVAALR